MGTPTLEEIVIEIVEGIRTISVKNIMERTGVPLPVIVNVIKRLQCTDVIRIAEQKGCKSGCSSCSSQCTETINESTVVVSMIYKRSDEYADE
jgi:hypothetical protein